MHRLRSPRLILLAGFAAALITGGVIAAERSANAMAKAAAAFVENLNPDQRQKATFPFQSDERLHWHFIPTDGFPRNGLTINEMTEPQRQRVHDLLKVALSQKGYLTAKSIMELEELLGVMEKRERDARASQPPPAAGAAPGRGRGAGQGMIRDPGRYFVSVFGTPSNKETWGWRIEGHHVSLHFDVINGRLVSSTPTFFGSNPAEIREGPQTGTRILGEQEDAARALLGALDESQRAKAVINTVALNDIVTGNKLDIEPLSPVGLTGDAMNAKQRDMLVKLIEIYASKMADDIASERMAKIKKAGIEKIGFAWAGEAERGKRHYYRIQGPTFLIEHDNSQNNGNHVHSIWRDFAGDFGRDLLREHIKTAHLR
jgi:hypothetical protein